MKVKVFELSCSVRVTTSVNKNPMVRFHDQCQLISTNEVLICVQSLALHGHKIVKIHGRSVATAEFTLDT